MAQNGHKNGVTELHWISRLMDTWQKWAAMWVWIIHKCWNWY